MTSVLYFPEIFMKQYNKYNLNAGISVILFCKATTCLLETIITHYDMVYVTADVYPRNPSESSAPTVAMLKYFTFNVFSYNKLSTQNYCFYILFPPCKLAKRLLF